jgi:hypothetical protein
VNTKALLLFAGLAVGANAAQAFNMGDMMSPNDWFDGNDDDDRYYRDRYYDRGYGGYGPYGGGWGGPYGGGYGPYGGYGGYGPYGGYGGYGYGGYPPAILVNPGQGGGSAPPPQAPE